MPKQIVKRVPKNMFICDAPWCGNYAIYTVLRRYGAGSIESKVCNAHYLAMINDGRITNTSEVR